VGRKTSQKERVDGTDITKLHTHTEVGLLGSRGRSNANRPEPGEGLIAGRPGRKGKARWEH